MKRVDQALHFAKVAHREANSMYAGKPYYIHLERALRFGTLFIDLVPQEHQIPVLQAVVLHDILEETHVSYNELKKEFGEEVAELVFAVTELTGRNRAERQPPAYYQKIRSVPFARFVKLCDRMANIEYSIEVNNKGKFAMYRKEAEMFYNQLFSKDFKLMFEKLERMLN